MKYIQTIYDSKTFTVMLLSCGITVLGLSFYKSYLSKKSVERQCGDSYSCKHINPAYENFRDWPIYNRFAE